MEGMERLVPLEVECPPLLEAALGYQGARRWVAFYWEPEGDELRIADGVVSHSGRRPAWPIFLEDCQVASHLRRWNFGPSRASEDPWLLLDCQKRLLFAGSGKLVARFLEQQILVEGRLPAKLQEAQGERGWDQERSSNRFVADGLAPSRLVRASGAVSSVLE